MEHSRKRSASVQSGVRGPGGGVGPGDEGDNVMDDEADEETLGSSDTDEDVKDVSFHF